MFYKDPAKAKQYIQGDVMLVKVGELPKAWQDIKGEGDVVLATGESGNVHVITENAIWLRDAIDQINKTKERIEFLSPPDSPNQLLLVTAPTQAVHQPQAPGMGTPDSLHAPLVLEPGIYSRVQQQEFDYSQQRSAAVFD